MSQNPWILAKVDFFRSGLHVWIQRASKVGETLKGLTGRQRVKSTVDLGHYGPQGIPIVELSRVST